MDLFRVQLFRVLNFVSLIRTLKSRTLKRSITCNLLMKKVDMKLACNILMKKKKLVLLFALVQRFNVSRTQDF